MFSHPMPRSSASTCAATALGARPTTLPFPCAFVHAVLQRVHGGGLACAGRADEEVDLAAGHGDPRERLGLLAAEQVFLAGDPLEDVEARPPGR